MSRKGRKLYALLIVGIPGLAAAAAVATEKPAPSITVENGTLTGSAEGGVESWKGIPYAAPPIGPLRWRAPQPAAPWNGVRQATAYRNDCMQEPFPSDAAPLGTPPAEDCLYANVWRPAGAAAKLPVLEVTNPFMVTEVYVQEGGTRKLAALAFTRLLTP